ncbi:hypothetical protein [Jeongeupia naejangsanensis]|uniref:Peptidylprolyl isomerase n=1 Tax=Jeongeupia naejangsanensis TaxID=613195 RepID=A0ABS2BJN7_9NEIS|nr:hypothetical protein [Jeongeupia naejangsanensis]MBM3115809.1 hypothetical protein [Jeongeupia naejangsanensis]
MPNYEGRALLDLRESTRAPVTLKKGWTYLASPMPAGYAAMGKPPAYGPKLGAWDFVVTIERAGSASSPLTRRSYCMPMEVAQSRYWLNPSLADDGGLSSRPPSVCTVSDIKQAIIDTSASASWRQKCQADGINMEVSTENTVASERIVSVQRMVMMKGGRVSERTTTTSVAEYVGPCTDKTPSWQ